MQQIPQLFNLLARKCTDRLNKDGRLDNMSVQPIQLAGGRLFFSILAGLLFLLSNLGTVHFLGAVLFVAVFRFFDEIIKVMEWSLPTSHPMRFFGDAGVLLFLYICLGFGQTTITRSIWPFFFGILVGLLAAGLIIGSHFLRQRLLDKDSQVSGPAWEVFGYQPVDLFYLMPLFALFGQLGAFLVLSLPVFAICLGVVIWYYYKQDEGQSESE